MDFHHNHLTNDHCLPEKIRPRSSDHKGFLLKEKLFSKNQIQSLIKDFKRPNIKSYSQSLLKDTLRHKELKNWLSYLRKN